MGTKLKAILTILNSRKFILVSVDKGNLKTHGQEWGDEELSVNILVSTMLLRIHEEITQRINDQAAEAGQLRNLEAVRDAVKALEMTDVR